MVIVSIGRATFSKISQFFKQHYGHLYGGKAKRNITQRSLNSHHFLKNRNNVMLQAGKFSLNHKETCYNSNLGLKHVWHDPGYHRNQVTASILHQMTNPAIATHTSSG